jgi:hypothetical protein
MPSVFIRNETDGIAWRVWPEPQAIIPGAIHEAGVYLFELHDSADAGSAELVVDDRPIEALRVTSAGVARWRWSPGFHAGTIDVELRIEGNNPIRFEVVTDPDIRKLSREAFDAMVREILEDTFALFSLSSFRRGIARGSGKRPPAIARLEFLRSRVDQLQAVVSAIVRNPRHMLTAEETAVPYYRATRATGPEILKSFRTGSVRSEQRKPTRLPTSLKGFLPSLIRSRQRRSSFDIPEHRQIGACLRAWSAWLSAVADTLARNDDEDAETRRERSGWAARARRISRRLARMAGEAPFADAGEAAPRLMLSALFRNDPDYRRFFRLWQDMNWGIASVFGDFLDMPLARTFELYELWCFLRLVRAAVEEYGPEGFHTGGLFIRDSSGSLTIAAQAVTVQVGNGWILCFQKSYREFWIEPDGRGSFSREMTPDVAAMQQSTQTRGARLIILDAKYRIEEGLTAALNSIHTYRDALVHEVEDGSVKGIVSAAYLLTPYVPEIGETYRGTPMPGRLFHPEYRSTFRFGAVTMRPGMTLAELRNALRMISTDAIE